MLASATYTMLLRILKVVRAARHVHRAGDHQVARVSAGAAEIGRDVAREERIELAGLRIDHGRPHVAREKIEEVERFDAVIDSPVAIANLSMPCVAEACSGTLGHRPSRFSPMTSPTTSPIPK